MAKLEKQYKSDGCEVSLARLRQNLELMAPPDMHAQIKDTLTALAQIDELIFEVPSSPFVILINTDSSQLLSLVKSKCYLEKSIRTQRINIPIPTAAVPDFDDPAPEPAKATPPSNNTSITIGQSTITVAIGDLSKQPVSTKLRSHCRGESHQRNLSATCHEGLFSCRWTSLLSVQHRRSCAMQSSRQLVRKFKDFGNRARRISRKDL